MGAPEWVSRIQTLIAASLAVKSRGLELAERLPGFRFDERMAGTLRLLTPTGAALPSGPLRDTEDKQRAIELKLHVRSPRLVDYLRDGHTELTGTVSIEGLVTDAPLTGFLYIWPQRRILRYELMFLAPAITTDGAAGGEQPQEMLRLEGQKDILVLDFLRTITTLPFELCDAQGRQVGAGTVYFDMTELPQLVGSVRPVPA